MVVESVDLKAEIPAAVAIGQIYLVSLLGLQVDIPQLKGIGTNIQPIAGQLIDRRRPKAFADIQLNVVVVRQLPGSSPILPDQPE